MQYGQKPIEDVQVGDFVKTFNEETNKVEVSCVEKTFIHKNVSDLLIINDTITTTRNHPFYINGEWVEADDLKIGYELLHLDGTKHKITSIEETSIKTTVYNFEVAKTHNYFAEKYLVHNKNVNTVHPPYLELNANDDTLRFYAGGWVRS